MNRVVRWLKARILCAQTGLRQARLLSIVVLRGPHQRPHCWDRIDAAQRSKPRVDRLPEVPRRAGRADRVAQDFPHLLFHRTAVLRLPHAQAAFQIIIQIANRDAMLAMSLSSPRQK